MSSLRSSRFPEIAAAILAGGMASRMGGVRKAFLDLGGDAILDRQLAVLRPRFPEILVAVGAPARDPDLEQAVAQRGLRPVRDHFPAAGPLAGIEAALRAATRPWVFAVACDMPFLDGDLIDRMMMLALIDEEAEAVVPVRRGRPEPLHALYRSSAAGAVTRCLESDRRAVVDLLAGLRTRLLKERDLPGITQSYTWVNLNTPDDLEAAADALVKVGSDPEDE